MNLALFIHDLYREIGHSRGIIEKIANMPSNKEYNLTIVCFKSDFSDKLFPPNFKCNIVKFPFFSNIKPVLLKSILFQIFSYIYALIFIDSKTVKIGVGTAALNVDIVEVPFIHKHYEEVYKKEFKYPLLKSLYKNLLFKFDIFSEHILFSNPKVKITCLSQFMQSYLIENFTPKKKPSLIYYGINQEHFPNDCPEKIEIVKDLSQKHPLLSNLDLSKNIYLFVGALERKGIHKVLEQLNKLDEFQLIIVGESETKRSFAHSSPKNIIHIDFSNEIFKFYQLADHFIFPTLYEPFGLVVLEAFAMGLNVIVKTDLLGSYELIKKEKYIYDFDKSDISFYKNLVPLSIDQKQSLMKSRMDILAKYTWENAGNRLYKLIS